MRLTARMPWARVLAIGTLLCSTASSLALGQVVRGRVTQETSAAPVAGALIELLFADSADARAASVLSDPAGGFELRAPGGGRYRLSAKRIGVRRYTSAPFLVAAGETRTQAIVLAAVDYRLPTVVVTASAICAVRPTDRARVTALWDEARTALDAAEISLRDKLFSANVTRYVRTLDPTTLRVITETRSVVRGVVAAPFNSLPADSLSKGGYWREEAGGRTTYYGPDPSVLLSDAFLDDHCFRPVGGAKERAGLTGLAFVPTAGRRVPTVVGTLWLDAQSYELRLVEFGYDRVSAGVDSSVVGGELHFARLPNGAWLVRRWFLRVPVKGRSNQPVTTEGSSPWVLLRPTEPTLSEEGGEVTTDEMRPPARPASIDGVLRDSTGRTPIAGAVVGIGGSSRVSTTDALGRFAFEALPPGPVALVGRAPGYDAFGVSAASANVQLADGERRTLTLTALDARALTLLLCDGRAASWGRGTVHATLRDPVTGAPVAGARVTMQWLSTIGQPAGDSVAQRVTRVSDAQGQVTFCEVPSDRRLTLRVGPANGGALARVETSIAARAVRHVDVTLAAGRPNE